MAFLVYKLTCTVSGKSYVGITARALETRWLEHCARARQGVREGRLSPAIRKYGAEAFTREILATADTEDQARSLETHFIRELGTLDGGYNCNEGGAGWLVIPDDVRQKISAAQRGKVISDEAKAKMSAAKKAAPSAHHLADHLLKGAANPRARSYLVRFPDGSERVVTGLRKFCRDLGLASSGALRRGCVSRGHQLLDSDVASGQATHNQGEF